MAAEVTNKITSDEALDIKTERPINWTGRITGIESNDVFDAVRITAKIITWLPLEEARQLAVGDTLHFADGRIGRIREMS